MERFVFLFNFPCSYKKAFLSVLMEVVVAGMNTPKAAALALSLYRHANAVSVEC